jgi:polysaccharide export outer membrane protein
MLSHLRQVTVALMLVLATALAASAQGYQVQPGDVLRIEVLQDEDLNRNVLVAPDGRITFPLAGTLPARGRSLEAIQSDLTEQLAPNFSTRPTVLVSLERLAPEEPRLPPGPPAPDPVIAIFALGEVATAGRVELVPGTRLIQALAQLGGLSDFAARERLQLRRFDPHEGREKIYPLNYDAIISGRSPNGAVVMQEGDVIFAPTRRLFE